MKKAILAVVTNTIFLTSTGWSQTVYGAEQRDLTNPNGSWNDLSHQMIDDSSGVFRIYWSCGNPDGICVGRTMLVASRSTQELLELQQSGWNLHWPRNGGAFFGGEPITVSNSSPAVCDIQDPTVVQYDGTYYLFAGAIPAGSPGCGVPGNEHAGIYSFSSPDGLSWSPLNGGNPVITVPADTGCYECYMGHGNWSPSAVVMGSGSFIRVYYSQDAPGYGPNGIMSMDTCDGVNFFNQRFIFEGAWAACVKRVGLSGDYPMVMTYRTSDGDFAATSSWSSDTSWTVGNGGSPIITSPAAGYPPTIDGDQAGLFGGGSYSSPVSGEVDFWWPSGSPSRIYRGQASAAQFFNF
jgi:hypothetical protein